MDFVNYLINNIPLFSISAVMIFLAFRNIRIRKRESIYFLVFTTLVIFLSVVVTMERWAQRDGLPIVGTIFTSFGYIIRPILLFIFILLANMDQKRSRRFYIICSIPLAINVLIYLFPLLFNVPVVSTMVFSYAMNDDGTAQFVRGGPLNFFSHAMSVIYLGLLIIVSTVRFQGKHRRDGIVLVLCVGIILITVITEVLTGRNDLLNIVSEICAMINYIFIMSVNASRDPLTHLYDRRTYNEDVSRYKEQINGIIELDMNELKYINDHLGHSEGDNALKTLADIFETSVDPSIMCAYRISGDEFMVLMFQGKKEKLEKTVGIINDKLEHSKYSAALGYYFFEKNDKTTFDQAVKKAEALMYKNKDEHYAISKHERREQ